MRFIVFGAGAIGGVIGGRLFQHGHDVALIARGAHLTAMRESGLRLESPEESLTLPVPVADDPAQLSVTPDDVVLLTVKGQHTLEALQTLAATAPARTPVVCAQNGVANEPNALRLFPDVYGMSVMCPAVHLEPGLVLAHASPVAGVLDLGPWCRSATSARSGLLAEEIAGALESAGFVSTARKDISAVKYGKLLSNLGNAIEAVCGPEARRGPIDELAQREGVACYEAAGIDYSMEDPSSGRADLIKPKPIGSRGRRGGGSSWQSLRRGAGTIETDYLNGEIVLLGRLHGVATPINELLQRTANRMAREGLPPGLMSEEEFLTAARG